MDSTKPLGITVPEHPYARGPFTNVPGYHLFERLPSGAVGNQVAWVYNVDGTDANAHKLASAPLGVDLAEMVLALDTEYESFNFLDLNPIRSKAHELLKIAKGEK